jgi:hypothetical protein
MCEVSCLAEDQLNFSITDALHEIYYFETEVGIIRGYADTLLSPDVRLCTSDQSRWSSHLIERNAVEG